MKCQIRIDAEDIYCQLVNDAQYSDALQQWLERSAGCAFECGICAGQVEVRLTDRTLTVPQECVIMSEQ